MQQLFHDGGPFHIETSPLICRVNQWTSFYMITASVMKELIELQMLRRCCLIQVSIVILRHFLYLPGTFVFLPRPLSIYFVFLFIFIFIKNTHLMH